MKSGRDRTFLGVRVVRTVITVQLESRVTWGRIGSEIGLWMMNIKTTIVANPSLQRDSLQTG